MVQVFSINFVMRVKLLQRRKLSPSVGFSWWVLLLLVYLGLGTVDSPSF